LRSFITITLAFTIAFTWRASVNHSGPCDDDVMALSKVPAIKEQLDKIDTELLKNELSEYGAWDEVELSDHEQNIQRILWLAGCDIDENEYTD